MNGLMIKLPTAVTDTTLPILYPDAIMSKGSLVLMDVAAKPVENLDNATKIYNIAHLTAKDLIGSGDLDALSPYIQKQSQYNGNIGFAEITPKKGIHTMVSQVNHTSGGASSLQCFNVRLPALLCQHLYTNRNHQFFMSVWRRTTRLAVAGIDYSKAAILFRNTGAYLLHEHNTGSGFTPNAIGVLGRRNSPGTDLTTLGNYIKNIAVSAVTGDIESNAGTVNGADYFTGNSLHSCGGGINAFGNTMVNKCPSFITYRVYIEDLTVSGRTYAEVDVIDKALYDVAFAQGGKFYGDTFSDPAVVLP